MIIYDVYVTVIAMPGNIRSFVRENPDGSYNIVINECLSDAAREERLCHELAHIYNSDFEERNVDLLEAQMHLRASL